MFLTEVEEFEVDFRESISNDLTDKILDYYDLYKNKITLFDIEIAMLTACKNLIFGILEEIEEEDEF